MISKNETEYKGYKRIDFKLNNYTGSIIVSKVGMDKNRWIWRTEFLGAFDKADMELVKQGWHLVYYQISDMYGCPKAVESMSDFHDYIVEEFNLCYKAVLFGFSRGGLYAVNYAVKYPQKVESIYLDAPVIDILSWPKGDGVGEGSKELWPECLQCYGFDENTAANYSKTQLTRADILAANKIPILVVAGGADVLVPYEENAKLFVQRYKETHDDIDVIIKKDCGHHPHSLDDVSPIIEFVTKHRQ